MTVPPTRDGRRGRTRTTPTATAASVVRRTVVALVLVASGGAMVGIAGANGSSSDRPAASPEPARTGSAGGFVAADSGSRLADIPTALTIPAIEVESSLLRLGLHQDGTLEVPSMAQADQPGWYVGSSGAGRPGPVVIAGHLDSDTGPAVFYRLADLTEGDRIIVERLAGSPIEYEVTRITQFPKDRFPTEAVYGETKDAEIRLITCSGGYRSTTGYDDNLVVFGRLVE